MDAKLSLLVLLVVCLQSTQVNGGRCGKKKQCCPQISNVVQCPPCPGSEADPTDLTPPMLYLNFTDSSEGVILMNDAEQDENGLTFDKNRKQYALLNDSLRTNATCILFPSECPNGFTVSMLVDTGYCKKPSTTLGILTTVYPYDLPRNEGIRIVCQYGEMHADVITDVHQHSTEFKLPDTDKIRMTFALNSEEFGISAHYNEIQLKGNSTKKIILPNENAKDTFTVGIGQFRPGRNYYTFQGTFADLMVWNRTLTEKEVQAIGTTDQY